MQRVASHRDGNYPVSSAVQTNGNAVADNGQRQAATGSRQRATGSRKLVTGSEQRVTNCALLPSKSIALLDECRCQLPVICYQLFVTSCPLSASRYLLFALDRLVEMELCCRTDRFHNRTNDIIQIVIRNSQLLLGLILSLLLIGAGLFGFGKKTVLTAAM